MPGKTKFGASFSTHKHKNGRSKKETFKLKSKPEIECRSILITNSNKCQFTFTFFILSLSGISYYFPPLTHIRSLLCIEHDNNSNASIHKNVKRNFTCLISIFSCIFARPIYRAHPPLAHSLLPSYTHIISYTWIYLPVFLKPLSLPLSIADYKCTCTMYGIYFQLLFVRCLSLSLSLSFRIERTIKQMEQQ